MMLEAVRALVHSDAVSHVPNAHASGVGVGKSVLVAHDVPSLEVVERSAYHTPPFGVKTV
jgi:hypothetical protein